MRILPPPISTYVDLELYSDKLCKYASFVVVEDNGEVIGFTAYYQNTVVKQLYIPLICVNPKYQSQGIGGKMLQSLEIMLTEGFDSIGLEVKKTNNVAYKFYTKHGFIEKEDRGEKYLMEKSI